MCYLIGVTERYKSKLARCDWLVRDAGWLASGSAALRARVAMSAISLLRLGAEQVVRISSASSLLSLLLPSGLWLPSSPAQLTSTSSPQPAPRSYPSQMRTPRTRNPPQTTTLAGISQSNWETRSRTAAILYSGSLGTFSTRPPMAFRCGRADITIARSDGGTSRQFGL